MFSTLYDTYFPFEIHFNMSSAICFNLDQSKILSSGNGLTNLVFHAGAGSLLLPHYLDI